MGIPQTEYLKQKHTILINKANYNIVAAKAMSSDRWTVPKMSSYKDELLGLN
jgi:hypothetical protein